MKRSKLDKALATALPTEQVAPKQPIKLSPLSDPTKRARGRVKVALPDRGEHSKQSLDKHSGSLRYKAAYAADLLAEDIISVFRRSGKKDKEYLKGLVWSFGVLFDKATGGQSTDAVNVRIPAKLLENVNSIIAIQVSRHAAKPAPQVVNQDTESCATVIESTGSEVLVAPVVANLADGPSSASPASPTPADDEPPTQT